MWDWPEDDFSWLMDDDMFAGGVPDFSELPMMDAPTFDAPLEMESWYGDPYGDWGGGQGGDGTDGSYDFGGSSVPSWLQSALGLGKGGAGLFGKGGGLGADSLLGALLPLLGMGAGAWNANKQTDKATEMLQQAAKDANAFAVEQIGGARDAFKPYQTAGTDSLAGIQALLAGDAKKYTPIKSKQMAPRKGAMTLAQLAAR
jgi:hypothetical protein